MCRSTGEESQERIEKNITASKPRENFTINEEATVVLKPIPEKEMSEWARVASQAHRRATRKKRVELRQRGLSMIIWKDGKVREVPA
ncbi:MAG TPA: hypothetical protein VF345_14460 [Chthoniobacterales bacterium]